MQVAELIQGPDELNFTVCIKQARTDLLLILLYNLLEYR